VVVARGRAYGPSGVEAVHIRHDGPLALFDAAVEGGYLILGIPGKATA
jgi:hypothetical protein